MGVDPHAPVTELVAALRSGEVSSSALLEAYLARIETLDGPVKAVLPFEAAAVDRARAEAAAADAARQRGAELGPLHGVPITVKDALETAGIRSTGGSASLREHVPGRDATAVRRLREAGAIVFAKTNLPEWSGDMQSYNELFGTTANPWELTDSPGGSSGGAAAAVACGFTAFELGTDIGGSIRIPAHLCGTFGLRPSHGLVPSDGYLAGPRRGRAPLDVNVVGPLTRSAADLDLLLDVLAGPSADDAAAWTLRLPPAPGRGRLRVGLWLDDPFCPVDTGYRDLLRATADRLADAGVQLVEARPAVSFAESFETYWTLLGAAPGYCFPDADSITHRDWLEADEERLRQRAAWHAYFEDVDALLCPVLAVPRYPTDLDGTYATRAVEVNGRPRTHVDIARWTGLVGALGLPVAVAPAGTMPDGRPAGVQIIARRWHDRTATALAGLVADLAGGYRVPPGY